MPFPGYSTKGCSPGHAVAVMGAAVAPDTLPTGNTALIAALGGNSNVFAFYDGRNNATATTWDDTRGAAGFGPQLAAAGSGLAYDDTNFRFTTGGSGYMVSAAQAALDFTATDVSVIVVGKFVATALSLSVWGGVSTLLSRGVGVIVTGATDTIRAYKNSDGSTLETVPPVPASANVRVAMAGWGESGTNNRILDIPDATRVVSNSTAQGAGTNIISVFGRTNGQALAPNGSTIAALIVCKSLLSETAVDAIRDWAVAQHGAVAA